MKVGLGRRRNFFINTRIQCWVMLTMGLICVCSIVAFGVVVDMAHRLSVEPWLNNIELRNTLEDNLYPQIDNLFLLGIPLFLLLTLALAMFLTHRVAGPVHHIGRVIREHRYGRRGQRIVLREGDYCEELANEVNSLLDELEKKEKQGQ